MQHQCSINVYQRGVSDSNLSVLMTTLANGKLSLLEHGFLPQ